MPALHFGCGVTIARGLHDTLGQQPPALILGAWVSTGCPHVFDDSVEHHGATVGAMSVRELACISPELDKQLPIGCVRKDTAERKPDLRSVNPTALGPLHGSAQHTHRQFD
ncbi:hypothetical protein [Sphingomonas melonis]|uniref:hypothetical protein n=1 Tax=Sphingomonas melonis TaxID=152682 RepID=UPI0035C7E9F8